MLALCEGPRFCFTNRWPLSLFNLSPSLVLPLSLSLSLSSTVVDAGLLSSVPIFCLVRLLVGAPVSVSPDFYRSAIYASPLSDWVFIAYFEISIRC